MGRKQYDRDEVLGISMELFWLQGCQATSMQDLCEATGLNRKSLYAEFGSKDALYVAALERYIGGAMMQTQQVLGRTPLGADNLRAYFGGMRFGPDCRGCLMTMTANERTVTPPEARQLVRQTLERIGLLLRDNLVAAGVETAAAEDLATFLIFSIQGITTMGRLTGDEAALRPVIAQLLAVIESHLPYHQGG